MWGLPDYDPLPSTTVEELTTRHGDRLAALVGRRLCRTWGLCFVGDGDRVSTWPVVLDFDGIRLEVAVSGFDRLYLSWNEIELDGDPDIPEQDDPDLAITWRELDLPELRPVTGRVLDGIRVLQNDFRFEPVEGDVVEAWLLGGLELIFRPDPEPVLAPGGPPGQRWESPRRLRAALQLYNGLNELALAAEDPDSPGWRRHPLVGTPATGESPAGPFGADETSTRARVGPRLRSPSAADSPASAVSREDFRAD